MLKGINQRLLLNNLMIMIIFLKMSQNYLRDKRLMLFHKLKVNKYTKIISINTEMIEKELMV